MVRQVSTLNAAQAGSINRYKVVNRTVTNSQNSQNGQRGRSFVDIARVISGLDFSDNKPYVEYGKRLGQMTEKVPDVISSRASLLAIDPSIPPSSAYQRLTGESDSDFERYSKTVNYLASAVASGSRILSYVGADSGINTNLAPYDTSRFESSETRFWGETSRKMARELGIEEVIFAGGSHLSVISSVIPQALVKSVTYGVYDGTTCETFGSDLNKQIRSLEEVGINILDGAINHIPGNPTELADTVISMGQKTNFGEANLSLQAFKVASEEGATQFKPYSISKYLLETHVGTGEVYLPQELKIIEIYKRNVYDKFGKKAEEECWQDFKNELVANVEEGIKYWKLVDAIKSGSVIGDLQEARKTAYKYVRLLGADKSASCDFTDYYELLKNDPKEFFKRARESALIFSDVSNVNHHGTPLEKLERRLTDEYGRDDNLTLVGSSEGNGFVRIRPKVDRTLFLPKFENLIDKKVVLHAAAKNEYEVNILAGVLERNRNEEGYVDVIGSKISKKDIYEEIIRQRENYLTSFKENSHLYKRCHEALGITALAKVGKGVYKKVKEIDTLGNPIFVKNKMTSEDELFREKDLILELEKQYGKRIIFNVSPEAYRRKEAEIYSLLSGRDIEYKENHEHDGSPLTFSLPVEAAKDYLPLGLKIEGILSNKKLINLLGKDRLNSLIYNLPRLFNYLLNYSGKIMALGGVLRLGSKFLDSNSGAIYNIGFSLSNGIRALCALGGALRGEINVNRYHNIMIGEVINFIAAFAPNGIKHGAFGLGNIFLFAGRGQQRAQAQQVGFWNEETTNGQAGEVDIPAREVTRLSNETLLKVSKHLKEKGVSPIAADILGSISSTAAATTKMLMDVVKNPGLIFKGVERVSGVSGKPYKSIPSSGHLFTLVGAISGLGAILAGTLGRIGKFGEIAESGFNPLGRWAISITSAIPALGLIANGKEIMENPEGFPMVFKGLHGSDVTYSPRQAGLRQIVAALGLGGISLGPLANKYVASVYDIFNGLYYLGVAEEEKINSFFLSRLLLGKGQKLYRAQ
ncbi:MAG: hypothetical protein HYR97_03600 [Candidatus Melainabacteria bacterium]|nr:hypothetical protein [Candidatus Melainabacteria bacterium]